jgi:signal transduction histidine kinase
MSSSSLDQPSSNRMFRFLVRITSRPASLWQKVVACVSMILVLVVIGWVDVASGPKVHLGSLYIAPILVAAWFGGRLSGHLVNLASGLVWWETGLLMGPLEPRLTGTPSYDVLNFVIRFVFYGLLVEMLVFLRGVGRQLEESVGERTAELRLEIADRLAAQESLRKLAAQLSAAEDVERRKLAYDIHDALSQMLGLVKMNLETVVAETAIDSKQFDRLSDVVKTVDDLIRQTREMTFDLHPSMLDHFGLIPTLQKFAQDFSRRTHAEVSVTESGNRQTLPSELASYLFRATKELVNNAVKHGNAREIILSMHWDQPLLRIVVDDDGQGFDPQRAFQPQHRRGLGLAGIDERMTSFGGKLSIESQPGNGTRIILEAPSTGQRPPGSAVTREQTLVTELTPASAVI